MRKFWFFFLILAFTVSCSTDPDELTITPPTNTNNPSTGDGKIILNAVTVIDDQTVKLDWSVTGNYTYQNFQIQRRSSENGVPQSLNQVNGSTFVKIDSEVPYSPYVDYQITGYTTTGQNIASNLVTYKRPDIKLLNLKTFDAQFDVNTGKLYLLDTDGKIAIYDVNSGVITHQINTNAILGYSDLGTYGGNTELYVSRKDGWVDVYDASNLNLKTQINFGFPLVSTVYHNGKLYASGSNYNPVKCMDRATNTMVSQSPLFYNGRIRKSIGSTVKLYTITQNMTPLDMDLYSFDLNGNYLNHQEDVYHGDHPLNHRIFEIAPDGRVITSNEGSIYNSQMIYQNNLPSGNIKLSSFDFDNTSIIAGNMGKTIDFYNINSYTKTKMINTKRFPYKIFSYNNKVVCVSSATSLSVQQYDYINVTPENVIIEVFDK